MDRQGLNFRHRRPVGGPARRRSTPADSVARPAVASELAARRFDRGVPATHGVDQTERGRPPVPRRVAALQQVSVTEIEQSSKRGQDRPYEQHDRRECDRGRDRRNRFGRRDDDRDFSLDEQRCRL